MARLMGAKSSGATTKRRACYRPCRRLVQNDRRRVGERNNGRDELSATGARASDFRRLTEIVGRKRPCCGGEDGGPACDGGIGALPRAPPLAP